MRAATYAKELGKTVSFSLAAFRQAFAAGRDLSDADNVAIAARRGRDPPARADAGDRAGRDQGAPPRGDRPSGGPRRPRRPGVVVGDEVFWGDDRLADAAAAAS